MANSVVFAGNRALDRLALLLLLALLAMVAMPVLVIFSSWTASQSDIWQHFADNQLAELLKNTAVLVFGVGLGVSLLGVSLAWLVISCDFPGRAALEWLLVLPMAIPAYVMAFVTLGLLDFSSPLQQGLAHLTGWQLRDVRSPLTIIVLMSLVLYPYVYLLARSAFLSQGASTFEVARSLGASPAGAFFRVVLPMARPAIVAGTALALMETLADFGTVAVFNYDTFTTAIYKSWFGFFNLQAAAQFASLLFLFAALALISERWSRDRGRTTQEQNRPFQRLSLRGIHAWWVSAYAWGVLFCAFVAPCLQLLAWALGGVATFDSRYWQLLQNTVGLGLLAMGIVVSAALMLALIRRLLPYRWTALLVGFTTTGYAIPGSVLAVGIAIAYAGLERSVFNPLAGWFGLEPRQWLMGTVVALLSAYCVRFLAVAYGPLNAGIDAIRPSMLEAARSLGASPWRSLKQIVLPLLRPSLLTAALLVMIDVMKEMPATLLLRPYGWDTFAVRIFELTSEGQWQEASAPALTLVLAGLLPVLLMMRASRRSLAQSP